MRVRVWAMLSIVMLGPPAGNCQDSAIGPVTQQPVTAAITSAHLTAFSMRGDADVSTIDIGLSGPSRYRVFTLRSPERLVIDLYDVADLATVTGYRFQDLRIARVRSGRFDAHTLRIVCDLAAAVAVTSAYAPAANGHGYRLGVALRLAPPVDPPPPRPAVTAAIAPVRATPARPPPAANDKVLQEALIPVLLNGQSLGDVYAVIGADAASSRFDGVALHKVLTPVLSAEVLQRLRKHQDHEGMISFADLATEGVTVTLDPLTVSALLSTDPAQLGVSRYDLHGRQPESPSDTGVLKPAPFSAALEIYSAQSWYNNARQPLAMELDGSLDVYGWVLQNRAGYQANGGDSWQRRETQVIKDWSERQRRLSIGDLNYPVQGLMGSRPLSGVSFGTMFDLQPYSVSFPLTHHEFFLETDARVDIYVNDVLRASRDLSAGPHDVFDLPLVDGVNQVMLRITDRYGRLRVLNFFDAQDQRLLQPGLHQYSFTVGVPRDTNSDGSLSYRHDTPTLSGFYRRGVVQVLTLGGHIEGNDAIDMAGIDGVWSSRAGTFSVDLAASRDRDVRGAAATALRLDYLYRSLHWSINAGYDRQARDFATLGQRAAADNTRTAARIGINMPPVAQWTSTLSLSETRPWQAAAQHGRRLSLTRGLSRDWYLSVDLGNSRQDGVTGNNIGVLLYWSPPGQLLRGNVGYASQFHEASQRIEYSHYGELGADARSVIRSSDRQRDMQFEAGYINSWLDTRVVDDSVVPRLGTRSDTTTVSLGTALVYVGGEFAVSRPLNGQPYALLQGLPSLGDNSVGIMRGYGSKPFAYLGGAGSKVVLPNLSPYYVGAVKVDLGDLALDAQLGEQDFKVLPGYRSGVLIKIGLEGEAYVLGTLLDGLGKPLVYVAGTLAPAVQSGSEPQQVFTDKTGHFEIAGLKPGRYRLRIDTLPGRVASFVVPEDSYGRLNVGELKLSEDVVQ